MVHGEDRLMVSLGADYPSRYVWRGQVLNDEAVLQPSVDVGLAIPGGTIGLNWWSVMDLTNYNGEKDDFTGMTRCSVSARPWGRRS